MIKTSQIQESILHGDLGIVIENSTATLDLGQHQAAFSETVIGLDVQHQQQIEQIIRDSLAHFPHEETLVQKSIEQPTTVARVDCSIDGTGIVPYECDDRPAGLGVLHLLRMHHTGQGVQDILQSHAVKTTGSEVVAVHHENAFPNDDAIVLDVVRVKDQPNGNSVLVRGEPHMFTDDALYAPLAERSVSTIRTEGDKLYTLAVSEYGAMLVTNSVELPERDASFVLKTQQGSKSKGVCVYLSSQHRKEYGDKGIVTYGKAERLLREATQPLILETFKPPIRTAHHGNMILRVIGLVGDTGSVKVIGGAYVARPEMLVHGARNAVCGLIMESDDEN